MTFDHEQDDRRCFTERTYLLPIPCHAARKYTFWHTKVIICHPAPTHHRICVLVSLFQLVHSSVYLPGQLLPTRDSTVNSRSFYLFNIHRLETFQSSSITFARACRGSSETAELARARRQRRSSWARRRQAGLGSETVELFRGSETAKLAGLGDGGAGQG